MIIAVDGPAGAGKGTISEYLAMKFDLMYLDTGLLYRALAKAVLRAKISLTNIEAVAQLAQTISVADIDDPDLRGEDIAAIASQVAVIEPVRQILKDLQQQFCQSVKPPYKGVILDGRDIGTVICPEATCKLFVTARPEVRNQRRLLETNMSSETSQEAESLISKKIAERDNRDSSRKIAPLTPAPDAIIIDTSDLTIDEACTKAALYVAECCLKSKDNEQ